MVTSRFAVHRLRHDQPSGATTAAATASAGVLRLGLIPKSSERKRVTAEEVLPLEVVAESADNNWTVLRRCDSGVFTSYASICGEADLPKQFQRVSAMNFSVSTPTAGNIIVFPHMHRLRVTRYLTPELTPKLFHKCSSSVSRCRGAAYPAALAQMDVLMLHGPEQLGAGSCGAPYFWNGKLVGFHVRSVDDIPDCSGPDVDIHFSEGYVLTRLQDFREYEMKMPPAAM